VAQYDNGEMSIDLEIVDSSFNDVVLAPMALFLQSTYSERSPDGYKQATTIGGHPAFEEWNSTARRADVHALVAGRFIVHATGLNVAGVDPVRALVQAVNLTRLAALK
jgi:hypothetical protein